MSWLLLWLTTSAVALAQSPERHLYYLGHIGKQPIQLELKLLPMGMAAALSAGTTSGRSASPLVSRASSVRRAISSSTSRQVRANLPVVSPPGSLVAQRIPDPDRGVYSEGGVELPFTLSRAAEYATFDLSQGKIRVRSSFPVFMQSQTRIFNAASPGRPLPACSSPSRRGRRSRSMTRFITPGPSTTISPSAI